MESRWYEINRQRTLAFVAVVTLVAAGGFLYWTGWAAKIGSREGLQELVQMLGPAGPLAIVGLMATAIVVSPLPSAPIAVAAGAMYGPVLGGAYVVAGAELGAVAAFLVARFAAYDFVRTWRAAKQVLDYLEQSKSQNWMALVIFVSRLLPFISFDAVSYAAGLTPLTFWRFALATFLGVIPVSLLLAYGGEALADHIAASPVLTALAVGGITAIPILAAWGWRKFKRVSR